MKMKAPLIGAALSVLALPALAQHPSQERTLSYTWAEASYGTQYAGRGDPGLRAPGAYRIASSFQIVPHVYVLGAYTAADFRFERASVAGIGVGTYAPLGPALHGVLQLTYERAEFAADGPDFEEDGLAAEAGVRWLIGAPELGLTLRYAALESDTFGSEERYVGINLAAVLPITDALGIAVRLERTSISGDVLDGVDLDTCLLGLRYGFGGTP